ncbi:MAG: peptide deformylase [Oscillospiraceae bacterium]|nr:peptide deformylase [Oscillospiraceae bacterium]
MVKEIVHDPFILRIASETASADDAAAARDLAETLEANKKGCVGMAANMIGVRKRIIAFYDNGKITVMFNPEITAKFQPYETSEGCLSLIGGPRPVTRYKNIKVRFQDKYMKYHEKKYSGLTAQIIQHETDHCNGVLI